MIKRPLLWVTTAFIVGIASVRQKPKIMLIITVLLTAAALIYVFYCRKNRKKFHNGCRLIKPDYFLIIISFTMFLGYILINEAEQESSLTQALDIKQEIKAVGEVTSISGYEENYLIYLGNTSVNINNQSHTGKTTAVYSDDCGDIRIGNKIAVTGMYYKYQSATNPGQFDEKSFYNARGIEGRLFAEDIQILDNDYSIIKNALYKLRMAMIKSIREVLPKKEAGVSIAMILGCKSLLDEEIKELYSKNGIAHILCISGLHISLIGMGLFFVLRRFGAGLVVSTAITSLIMILYGIMTGMSVSTKRAIIMLIIMLTAKSVGKIYDMLTAAAISALIILFLNSEMLFDSGFQLSFLAVLGIAAAVKIKVKSKVLQTLITSTVVQLFIIPVLLNNYYGISPYTIVINIIVLPLMSLAVCVSIITGILSLFSQQAGIFFAGTVHFILNTYEIICRKAETLPCFFIDTGAPQISMVVAYYIILCITILLAMKYRKKIYFLTVLICSCIFLKKERPEFYATFLDVGQGDSTYVEIMGSNFLIDCGSADSKKISDYRILPFLKWNGTDSLDYVVITHPDSDHINGLDTLLEEIKINNLVFPEAGKYNERIIEEARLAKEKEINVIYLSAGDKIGKLNSNEMLCLNPLQKQKYSSTNSYSIVLDFEYNGFSMLLTGDAEGVGEKKIIDYLYNLPETRNYTILKTAHHGSQKSTSQELLKLVNPKYSIISCGKNNRYGHPNEQTLDRIRLSGSTPLITAERGAVIVKSLTTNNFSLTTYSK